MESHAPNPEPTTSNALLDSRVKFKTPLRAGIMVQTAIEATSATGTHESDKPPCDTACTANPATGQSTSSIGRSGVCPAKDHQCPVGGCERLFCTTKNPRQSLWNHLGRQSKVGDMQAAHRAAHGGKRKSSKVGGTAAERHRKASQLYRSRNVERSKISSRHGNFRLRARNEGVPEERVGERVAELEQGWKLRRATGAEACQLYASLLLEACNTALAESEGLVADEA